jgi:PhnB protein
MDKAQEMNASERPSIAAMLSVRSGANAVAFYKAALGAEELFYMADTGGSVIAHLAIGPAAFWVSDESPENQNFSPESLGGSSARMIVVVDDPDALFAQAVAAGATIVWPVADKDYGWRVGRIVDPFGHHWEIGKPIG